MIRASRISKSFGSRIVLRNLEFSADPGEVISLIGLNGAGKTTFIRILATLMRADSGKIFINRYNISQAPIQIRKKIGVVLHSPMLYGDLTGDENLVFYAKLFGVQQPETRIDQILQLTNLDPRRKDLVRTYSRGMQQRLSIGRAILHNPDVLLLDEPYTGLDQDSIGNVDALLAQLAVEGKLILLTSHDLERALAVSSRIDILYRGSIADSLKIDQLAGNELKNRFRSITGKTFPGAGNQAD
ncbi:MAG: antibiotic transport system ATP-binding protein [Chloroflexi bacterium]|nr:MAG: antibiotic transport system ATP-binding protein [Chloroflexota bacterium]MBA4376099.1 sodium ABC transporter ATP-binding protein [Anaerolinea sp.]